MDRRIIGLIAFGALAAVIVGIILIGRAGDDDGGDSSSTDLSSKPEVEVPDGPPPDELVIEDIVEGDGAEAQQGDQVTVSYWGKVPPGQRDDEEGGSEG